ncbi:hypothetical protein Thein_1943 [Thermodesulfatator indicus DSM 15286]|uniref:Uncharacterized protein n=2 Tax=Thermodesulfatator indicus TaxID=171695 RepID=F8ACM3_THEID|nr:hypothetical protein Thein_1943 [Thermodesulfatator indicus DSM 15286]
MEIRAREGTALDDLAEAKEGLKEFFRELAEPGEPEPCCPCCPLREEEWLKRQEEWLWDDWCDYVDYELDPARGILDND